MHCLYIFLGLFLTLGFLNPLFADSIILKDGEKISGEIIEKDDGYLKVKRNNGAVEIYSLDKIGTFTKEQPVSKEHPAANSSQPVINNNTVPAQPYINAYPYDQLAEQIKVIFQAPGNGPRERPPQLGGPYDAELGALSDNMYDYLQQYQQAIAHTQNSIVGKYGDITVDPNEAMSGIVQQYREALENFDKTSEIYPDKRSGAR